MVNENDNEARASEEEIKMIQNAFNNFDVNGDGFMSKAELKSLLQKMGEKSQNCLDYELFLRNH